MIDGNRVVTRLGNIPWLSGLPSHWKVVRSKRLFTVRKERARPDDEQLSATQAYGVIAQSEFERRVGRKVVRITQHLDKRAHVEKDDFVISMRSFQGGLERAWARGCIRSSYVVLQPAPDVHINYFAHLFKSHDYIRALQATSNFIRDGQDLSFRNFALVDLPLPPMEEQVVIGRYLDHADRRIRRCIRAKRQLIVLLNEQKQAIIHRAVTRGLDPHVRLKPSGVEWLGDVPEHWQIHRNGFLFQERKEPGDPALPLLVVSLRTGVTIGDDIDENGRPKRLIENRANYRTVRKGDIAYNMMRLWQGAVGAAPVDGLVSPAYVVAKAVGGVDSRYFELLFRTTEYMAEVNRRSTGIVSDRNRCYWDDFKQLVSPVPPPQEQSNIVSIIAEQLRACETAINSAEREIQLLREHRGRLIADVVTGKLNVQIAAAALPDELDEVEPDAEELLDESDMTDDAELDTEPEEIEA